MADVQNLIDRVTAIAPLPHTAAPPRREGYAPIVGSNGRVLGWATTHSGDYEAVAELWATAPATIQSLLQRDMQQEGIETAISVTTNLASGFDEESREYRVLMLLASKLRNY